MYEDLHELLRSLMSRVVLPEILAQNDTGAKLVVIDLKKKSHLILAPSFELGFAADAALKKARAGKNSVSDLEILKFREGCRVFMIELCKKLCLECPLGYKLVRGLSCLSPRMMQRESLCKSRLEAALEVFVNKNRMRPVDADSIRKEFERILTRKSFQNLIKIFDRKTQTLDSFLADAFKKEDFSEKLEAFLLKAFIMFHGNASVERSFSVYKQYLVENLSEEGLVAQRSVHDAITTIGGMDNLVITRKIISAFKSASSNRNAAIARKNKEDTLKIEARKDALQELRMIKMKKEKVSLLHRQEM
ncbi:hypothetical protein QAD02_020245 [Eretmocerus hayati]|uniref:Uncharacterized protein n=1 Tax=Eretmocerus hayati TaxID=131215 RepID=A0ACC2PMX5_9HYME|nr:hypothetical protein QAD02_020245 [Eretmocerus hayati]